MHSVRKRSHYTWAHAQRCTDLWEMAWNEAYVKYRCTWICMYTYDYLGLHMELCFGPCMHVCSCMYVFMHACVYVYKIHPGTSTLHRIALKKPLHSESCRQEPEAMARSVYMHLHVYIYIYIYIYIYTHMCVFVKLQPKTSTYVCRMYLCMYIKHRNTRGQYVYVPTCLLVLMYACKHVRIYSCM